MPTEKEEKEFIYNVLDVHAHFYSISSSQQDCLILQRF